MNHYFLTLFTVGILMLMGNLCAESFWDMQPKEVRDAMNKKFLSIQGEKAQVADVKDITIKNGDRITPLRIYTPYETTHARTRLPIILFIHGGAWVAGNLDTHDNLARYLCRGVQALVVSVGYLNAPEGKFPTSLEQCDDALNWIVAHSQEFNANPKNLAVVGDSAGGNMAAALCLLARDQGGPAVDFQALINPVIKNTWGGLKRQNNELDNERWFATQYVKEAKDVNNPYVSLSFAKDLTHLPPALVILAEKDAFRQDAQDYADRLREAGVPTNVYIQWGVGHLAGNGARASPLAQESLDVAVAALRGAFMRNMESNPNQILKQGEGRGAERERGAEKN